MATDNPWHTRAGIWLDDDHFMQWLVARPEIEPCGGVLYHRVAAALDGWCCGSLYWRRPERIDIGTSVLRPIGDLWQLVSMSPLHIEPSFLCFCGHHGFIRDGAWQAA